MDAISSTGRSANSDLDKLKASETEETESSVKRIASDDQLSSGSPYLSSETTEDRLKSQSSPLSQITAMPTTAERLAGGPVDYDQGYVSLATVSNLALPEVGRQQASGAVSDAAQSVVSTAENLVHETMEAVEAFADPAEKIAQLNSDGDQVVMTALAQVEGQVVAGLKLRYGYDIKIEQLGDSQTQGVVDDANVQYQVSFNKRLLAGVGVELPAPIAEAKGELRGFTGDTVMMTFDTRTDAASAVRILQKAALTETASDAISAVNPMHGIPGSSVNSSLANPLRAGDATTSSILENSSVAPSTDELAFLNEHITGYSTTLGAEARAKFGVEAPALLGYELRLDAADTITRTVVLPQDGEPGRISYTISGAFDASSKEILDLGPKVFDAFKLTYGAENVVHHGELRSDISFHWDIPASEWPQADHVDSSSLPEASLFTTGNAAPSRIELTLTLEHQAQSLLDPSRTDLIKHTMTSTLDNPLGVTSETLSHLLAGDLDNALSTLAADSRVERSSVRIDRTGVRQEHGIEFEAVDVVEGKVKLIFEAGVDDTSPLDGAIVADEQEQPEAVQEMNNQLVVLPRNGLSLRIAPGVESERIGVFYHGTFVQPTGSEQLDAQGNRWLQVSGPDVHDQQQLGWVQADHVEPHPEGAMDAIGRMNPDLEADGYQVVVVMDGDNLWDLAGSHGVDFQDMVALNRGHLIEPDLIFAGDTVYIPDTAGEAPVITPEDETSISQESAIVADSTDVLSDVPEIPLTAVSGESIVEDAAVISQNESEERSGAVSNEIDNASDPAYSSSQPESVPEPVVAVRDEVTQPADTSGWGDLDNILQNYQVVDDPGGMIENYTPDVVPGPLEAIGVGVWNRLTGDDVSLTLDRAITAKEANLLDGLDVGGLMDLNDATQFARETARDRVGTGLEDGHGDAYRHALWNAVMTRELGEDFTRAFTNAHEGVPGNPADKEAMDLYNNEVGRNIAMQHPDANDQELAELVMDALNDGRLIVIDGNGGLAWSDQVAWGQTGYADDLPAQGVIDPAGEADSH